MTPAPGTLGLVIGIDVLEVARLEEAIARRPNLLSRLFTPAEREYAEAHARPADRPLANARPGKPALKWPAGAAVAPR